MAAPLYIARVTNCYEDLQAEGSERLCIEVQWYERRANMPAHLQAGMHDREVVEWLQTDTNLVGCIERKAARAQGCARTRTRSHSCRRWTPRATGTFAAARSTARAARS